MGRQLALESPVDADIVVPVPDSGVTAAMGFSHESGIPLQFGLIRNHYVGRTFIEPEQRVRDFGVKLKLNPVRHVLEGKRVVLIDDSIVRGTTSRKIVRMVRDAGRKGSAHAHLVSADDFALLLRSGHAFEEPAHRRQQVGGRDSRVHRRRLAGLSFAGRACARLPAKATNPATARPATPANIPPTSWTWKDIAAAPAMAAGD